MSLTSLTSSYLSTTLYSSTLEKPFKITIEAVNFVGAENVTYSKYDLQIGLFHGARPLCPEKTISLKNADTEVEFDITVSNVPRMAKLCFGLFEKKKNNPASWVNDASAPIAVDIRTLPIMFRATIAAKIMIITSNAIPPMSFSVSFIWFLLYRLLDSLQEKNTPPPTRETGWCLLIADRMRFARYWQGSRTLPEPQPVPCYAQ